MLVEHPALEELLVELLAVDTEDIPGILVGNKDGAEVDNTEHAAGEHFDLHR